MPTKHPRITKRRQDKRFYLLDWYKYAMGQIIANHRKLSPGAKGYGHALLNLFGTKPMFPANMTNLARHCGMTRPTERKYRRELEEAKLFRFVTPPYWARKNNGKATEIWFKTGTVTKWLRNHGLLTAKSDWVSRNDKPETPPRNADEMGTSERPWKNNIHGEALSLTAATVSTPTMEKIGPSLPISKEGGAYAAAPSLEARDAADAPPKDNSQKKGLGADFNGEWHKATQVEKPHWSNFDLDDDVRWPDAEADGFVIGFGFTGSATQGCVLVSWLDGSSPDSWVETAELESAKAEPEPVAPVILPVFRVGTRVRHLSFKDGTIEAIDCNKVTVLFDKYGERKILLAFLQVVDNEALADDILASAARVRTEQITG